MSCAIPRSDFPVWTGQLASKGPQPASEPQDLVDIAGTVGDVEIAARHVRRVLFDAYTDETDPVEIGASVLPDLRQARFLLDKTIAEFEGKAPLGNARDLQ